MFPGDEQEDDQEQALTRARSSSMINQGQAQGLRYEAADSTENQTNISFSENVFISHASWRLDRDRLRCW